MIKKDPDWFYRRLKHLIKAGSLRRATRAHQTYYNPGLYTYRKQSVAWSIGLYNKLRFTCQRLKLSLSYLVHLIMLAEEQDVPEHSYCYQDTFTTSTGLTFLETIKEIISYAPG